MFCADYMYMTKKPDTEQIMHPTLIIRERTSGGTWALPTLRKGINNNNIAKIIVEIIDSVGAHKIIIKTDQEPAIIDVQKEVRRELWEELNEVMNEVKSLKMNTSYDDKVKSGGIVILENSPVGESQSNGSVERAIKEVQHQIGK